LDFSFDALMREKCSGIAVLHAGGTDNRRLLMISGQRWALHW
jgi:hypothetical protein